MQSPEVPAWSLTNGQIWPQIVIKIPSPSSPLLELCGQALVSPINQGRVPPKSQHLFRGDDSRGPPAGRAWNDAGGARCVILRSRAVERHRILDVDDTIDDDDEHAHHAHRLTHAQRTHANNNDRTHIAKSRMRASAAFLVAVTLAAALSTSLPSAEAHGFMSAPRSRNFVAYEDGKWWSPDPTATFPAPEACPHCMNRWSVGACGVSQTDSSRDYSKPKDFSGNPLTPKIQSTLIEGQTVEVEFVLTAHHKVGLCARESPSPPSPPSPPSLFVIPACIC